MIKKFLIILSTILVSLICLSLVASLILYFWYSPRIAEWQIKNDNTQFVQHAYLVPFMKNLDSIDSHAILNIKKYESNLIQMAKQKGIIYTQLNDALLNSDKAFINTIPVLIETVNYQSRPAFAITYKRYYRNSLLLKFHLENIPLLKFLTKDKYISYPYVIVIVDKESGLIINKIQ